MTRTDRVSLIIAIALAFFLWAYVRLTHTAPEVTRVIQHVNVSIDGQAPSGFACLLHDENRVIDIAVKGPSERVSSLSQEDITVKVDVRRVNAGKSTLTPRVFLPKGIRLAREPQAITVIAYPLKQKTLPVSIAFIAQPPPGTTVGEYVVQPNSVTVEGSDEALQQVKYVTVRIDPNLPMTIEHSVVPRVVNADGEVVDNARVLNVSTVGVRMATLTGEQTSRQVAVGQPVLKNIRRGYMVRVLRIRPSVVTLSGGGALLDRLQGFVDTDPINAQNITSDTTCTVSLHVPRGLTAVEGSTVRVDLEVQPVQ
ncbi:MAG TPA: CdaR family protein [Armatimonadota bacterium]|nr:CdaR family protein [Armatimonadota bacterium]